MNKKNKVGRPTVLTPELVESARAYLMGDYKTVFDIVPSAAGLACYLGIGKRTIYDIAGYDNDLAREFSHILNGVQAMQEKTLINGGLTNTLNASIVKLMLGKHGYHDRSETDHKTSDGSKMQPTRIEIVSVDPKDIKNILREINEQC